MEVDGPPSSFIGTLVENHTMHGTVFVMETLGPSSNGCPEPRTSCKETGYLFECGKNLQKAGKNQHQLTGATKAGWLRVAGSNLYWGRNFPYSLLSTSQSKTMCSTWNMFEYVE